MDTLHLTTKPDSETAGKVDSGEKKPTTSATPKAPTAKRDRKAAPATKDAPVAVTDTEPTGEEDSTVTTEVKVTSTDSEPTAEDSTVTTEVSEATAEGRTVTTEVTVTAKDAEPTAEEATASDPTTELNPPTVTEPKKPTKADRAKAIYDEMVTQPNPDRKDIIARFKKDAGLTTSGAASYYYKFQKDSGRVVEKGPTKMDKARKVFQALTEEGKARKEIIAALIKDVGLTKSGASTYFQTLKKAAAKPTE
jgi:hypothetical protein